MPAARSAGSNNARPALPRASRQVLATSLGSSISIVILLALSALAMSFGALSSQAAEPPRVDLALVDAIGLALQNDPEIQLVETQVEASRGAALSARGSFDPELTSSLQGSETRTPLAGGSRSEAESLGAILNWSQTLRSGQTLTPRVSIDRDQDADGTVNTTTVSFALRQPLLRGRDADAVQAFEQAAGYEVAAARLDLVHTTSERLLAVVAQYWTVKAAWLDLEILRSTEKSSKALLGTTRRLIEAQLTPAAELVQLEADLVLREANRVVGERNLFQEVWQLGRELGLSAGQIEDLPLPMDPFPAVDPRHVPQDAEAYLQAAIQTRADLLASRQRLMASEQRHVAADDDLKPSLDFVVTPSFTGLAEGAGSDDFVSSLWTQIPGLSASFGIELTLPLRNHAAQGASLQAQASVTRSALLVERDLNAINSRIPSALETVYRNAERLEKLERAVALFERTVDNETKKLRAGTSTLIDVISQRDRLTSALQSRNSAQLALAIAVAQLRFETGTLIGAQGVTPLSIRHEDLTTLPP